MKQLLKDIFNQVYLRVYSDEYNFRNKKVEKTIDDFLKMAPETIGDDWLFTYTVFQFSHYDGMKTRFGRIYLNWIYGEKALTRWNERTEQQVYFAALFRQRIGVKKEQQSLNASEYRNAERWRFKDMNRQFIHCHETSLFEVRNDVCKECPMYKTCLTNDK